MVQKRTCDYTGEEIEPGTGTMFVRTDGTVLWFKDSKARKNYMLGRESRDLEWIGYEEEAETEAVEGQPEGEEGEADTETEQPADEKAEDQEVDEPDADGSEEAEQSDAEAEEAEGEAEEVENEEETEAEA